MIKKPERTNPDATPKQSGDQGDTRRTRERVTDMREANENIRKSQGDDAGQPPTIDRHRLTFVGANSSMKQALHVGTQGNLIVGIPIGGTHGASIRPYVLGRQHPQGHGEASDFTDKHERRSPTSRFSG